MKGNKVIDVVGVSKRYVLGKYQPDTLRDKLVQLVSPKTAGEEFLALKDLSFSVTQGDVYGIIGKNGAGKSTILKLISRITYPTKGYIELKGKVASLLEVGTGFHPELTGRENVFLNGSILGMGRAEIKSRFDEIVAFSGIERFIDTPVKHYSSGMYVRLAFAVAAHLEPEVLIIDEVLAVGDADFQKKCLGRMREVSDEGRTVVFVSHNIDAVRGLCTKGLVLSAGEKVFDGDIDAAISNYMGASAPNKSELTWSPKDPYQNGYFRLTQIQINVENDKYELELGDAFDLTFEFEALEPKDQDLDVTFELCTEGGISLLNSSTFYLNIDRNPTKGSRFTATCRFPDHLLNEGKYVISKLLIFSQGSNVLFEAQHCFDFEVKFNPKTTFGLKGRKISLLRPLFQWQLQSSNPKTSYD